VYLHRTPIDMRRGRSGLAALAKETMQLDPFSGALFIYIGLRFDALKILYWDKNGFALWWKKIESDEKYHWPRPLQQDVITLTVEQLNWLLRIPAMADTWTGDGGQRRSEATQVGRLCSRLSGLLQG
jgi:transposase